MVLTAMQDLKAVCAEVSEGLSEQDLQGMIEEADRDGDGLVNMEEFVQVMLKTNLFAWGYIWWFMRQGHVMSSDQ